MRNTGMRLNNWRRSAMRPLRNSWKNKLTKSHYRFAKLKSQYKRI